MGWDECLGFDLKICSECFLIHALPWSFLVKEAEGKGQQPTCPPVPTLPKSGPRVAVLAGPRLGWLRGMSFMNAQWTAGHWTYLCALTCFHPLRPLQQEQKALRTETRERLCPAKQGTILGTHLCECDAGHKHVT